jgi:hypothetical protein
MIAMFVSVAGAERLKVPPPWSASVFVAVPPLILSVAVSVAVLAMIVLLAGPPATVSFPVVSVKVWPGVTVTPMLCVAAATLKLSTALSVMVSEGVVASVSDRVARSLFTVASDPLIVRLVVPEPVTPVPVAESNPFVSASVTVKVSVEALAISARLTPAMSVGAP